MFDFSFGLGFVCERRSSPRVLRYPASRRSHARRQRMASRRREDGPPRTRRSCEVGRRRRPLLVLPSGPTSRFFLLSQQTAPPRNPGSKTEYPYDTRMSPARRKFKNRIGRRAVETNTPRARLVERLGPAGVVRRSARAAEGTTDRAGDSASSPRRFDARGADQGTRDRDQSFGGPRPAASPGGRARGCRRL